MYAIKGSQPDFQERDGLVPPQNLDVEEAVLGGLMLDPNAIARICDLLTPDAFYSQAHQEIYRAALGLQRKNTPVDLMSITGWMRDRGLLEKVGGRTRLISLVDATVSAANIDHHAALLMDKFTRRKIVSTASEISKMAYDTSIELASVLEASEQRLYDISDSTRRSDYRDCESFQDMTPRLFDLLESEGEGRKPGLSTGLYDLDAKTGGFKPGALIVPAGRASMGKTHFAVEAAYAIASIHQLPVVFFSCEMTKDEINTRFLARIAKVDSKKIADRNLSKQEIEIAVNAMSEFATLPIHVHDASNPSISEMRSVIRRVQSANNKPVALVILDYLQMLHSDSGNRVQDLDRLTVECKAIAKDFNCTFMALAQINRSVETRDDKRPFMSDIRECGAIEAHADQVYLFYRDEYYKPQSTEKGIIEVDVAKNRGGGVGKVKFLISPEYSLFRNMSR